MTDSKIRICIAEACGWKHQPYGFWSRGQGNTVLPDYPNDLNAMHEAEEELFKSVSAVTYKEELQLVCYKENRPDFIFTRIDIHATARQRSEAFLRTVGKWKDE